ncbi:methyltransferase domain-containing protein [Methylocaldum sp. MU1018]
MCNNPIVNCGSGNRFRQDGWIYDLGCSTGNTIKALLQRAVAPLKIVGVDNSPDMLEKSRLNFENGAGDHRIEWVGKDINDPTFYGHGKPSVVIMNLALQFTRPLLRKNIIKSAFENLCSGGCLILVEKTIQEDLFINKLFIEYYDGFKRDMGYTELEISKKREALENRLIPFFVSENMQMLFDAGFSHVSTFFQWMNFVGFLAVKD